MPRDTTLTAKEAASLGWTFIGSGWERKITQRDLAAVTAWERQEALRARSRGSLRSARPGGSAWPNSGGCSWSPLRHAPLHHGVAAPVSRASS
jgi:hypothetical protein